MTFSDICLFALNLTLFWLLFHYYLCSHIGIRPFGVMTRFNLEKSLLRHNTYCTFTHCNVHFLIISENLQSCVTITIYQVWEHFHHSRMFPHVLCSWSPLLPLIPDNPYLLSVTTNLPFPDILSLQILIAIIFYLSIHSCLIISSLLLLWVKFLWPFTYKFLCGRMFFTFLR